MKEKIKPLLITSFFVIIQSLLYFIAKFSPFYVHVIGNNIDKSIPFIPVFVFFYYIWYLMLFCVPILIYNKDKKSYWRYIITTFICCIISFFIYVFYPTTMLRPIINSDGIIGLMIKMVYLIDTPILNCLPSMHCIICFIFILICIFEKNNLKFIKYLIVVLSFLVILSTVLIKQHVIVDVVSAFIISVIVYLIVKKSKWATNLINKLSN